MTLPVNIDSHIYREVGTNYSLIILNEYTKGMSEAI